MSAIFQQLWLWLIQSDCSAFNYQFYNRLESIMWSFSACVSSSLKWKVALDKKHTMIKGRPFISSALCSIGIDYCSFKCINHDLSCSSALFTASNNFMPLKSYGPHAQSKFNLCNCTNIFVVGNDVISTVPEAPNPRHNCRGWSWALFVCGLPREGLDFN